MQLLARIRWIVARRPWVYWSAVATIAGAIALQVNAAMGRVDAARRAWGTGIAVWVADHDTAPGEVIAASRRSVPQAIVPAAAVTSDPTSSQARQHVGAGEIVTTPDVATPGPAGLIPTDWVAVAVPSSSAHFAVGDAVVAFAAEQRLSDGIVVDLGDSDVLVAVPPGAGGPLSAAVLTGSVALALSTLSAPSATSP